MSKSGRFNNNRAIPCPLSPVPITPTCNLFDAEANKLDGIIDAAVPSTADVFIKFLRFINFFILTPY